MFALVEYAKTGADVLFVMNYPAYLEAENCENYAEVGPGLGFQYGARQFFVESGIQAAIAAIDGNQKLTALLKGYFENGCVKGFKRAFTDLAFNMVTSVWAESRVEPSIRKGNIYFCIGGVNSVNPFSAIACKNELFVYSQLMESVISLPVMDEGSIIKSNGDRSSDSLGVFLDRYSRILLDFNGSAAFYDESWRIALAGVYSKVKGLFVMGGVHSYEKSLTMPRIEGSLNRLSCATMNQLYHPEKTSSLFTSIYNMNVPVFIISNNSVSDYETYKDVDKKQKSDVGWQSFLVANKISHSVGLDRETGSISTGSYLWRLAAMYYNSRYNPPRKPYDYYTSIAVSRFLSSGCDRRLVWGDTKTMFYDCVYGITMVANGTDWGSVCSEYLRLADVSTEIRKKGFAVESGLLKSAECESISVTLVRFAFQVVIPGAME
jgi:hypothetical protein